MCASIAILGGGDRGLSPLLQPYDHAGTRPRRHRLARHVLTGLLFVATALILYQAQTPRGRRASHKALFETRRKSHFCCLVNGREERELCAYPPVTEKLECPMSSPARELPRPRSQPLGAVHVLLAIDAAVVTTSSVELVAPEPAVQAVVAGASEKAVATLAAEEIVVPLLAKQLIVAGPPDEVVG
jgi:hypothetical protein